jgi:diguanylate cyclase (GGDEF)-like protein/PAS domain S-box-containing protein
MSTILPSETLLEHLLAGSDEALVGFRTDGTIVLWNRAAQGLYGFTESEVLGKSITQLLPLYELPALEELLGSPLRIDSSEAEVTERLHKEGMRVPVHLQRSLVRSATGEILSVLERTRTLSSNPAGAPSQNHFRLMVQQMPVLFWTTDQRLRITSHWGPMLGVHRRMQPKAIGQTIHEFLRCPQDEDAPVKQHLAALNGISSRFEYKRRKHVFDISLEPLRDSNGSILGCIGVALDITERKKTEEEIRHQATHDGLTGLVNYREFYGSLEKEVLRAERSHHSFGLLLLDLDDLKGINDRLGHLAGNRALRRLARVMKENCRASDIAARYGGDEFAILLIDADAERAQQIAQRIANRLSEQPDEPRLSVSIGSAVYPEDGQSPQDLLEAADRRLYRNKKALRWQTADAD